MKIIKVYLGRPQQVVEAELVEDKGTTCMVKLPDGNIIKRKKKSQVVPNEA